MAGQTAVVVSAVVGTLVLILVVVLIFSFTRVRRRQRARVQKDLPSLPDIYYISRNSAGTEKTSLSMSKSTRPRSMATIISTRSSLPSIPASEFPLPPASIIAAPTPPPSARLLPTRSDAPTPALNTKDLPNAESTPSISSPYEGYPTSSSSELHHIARLVRGLSFVPTSPASPPAPPPTPSALARLPPLQTEYDRKRTQSTYTTMTMTPTSPASELQHVQRLVRGLSFLPRRGPSRTASRSSLGTLATVNTFTTANSGHKSDRERPDSTRQSLAPSSILDYRRVSISPSVVPLPVSRPGSVSPALIPLPASRPMSLAPSNIPLPQSRPQSLSPNLIPLPESRPQSLAPPTRPPQLLRQSSKNMLRRPLWDTEPSPRWDQVEFRDVMQLRPDGREEDVEEQGPVDASRTSTRPKLFGPRQRGPASSMRRETPRRAFRELPPLPQKTPREYGLEWDIEAQRYQRRGSIASSRLLLEGGRRRSRRMSASSKVSTTSKISALKSRRSSKSSHLSAATVVAPEPATDKVELEPV